MLCWDYSSGTVRFSVYLPDKTVKIMFVTREMNKGVLESTLTFPRVRISVRENSPKGCPTAELAPPTPTNRVNALAIKAWKKIFTSTCKYQNQRQPEYGLLTAPDNITTIGLEEQERSVPQDYFFGRAHTNRQSAMRLWGKLVWNHHDMNWELYLVATYKRSFTKKNWYVRPGREPMTHWTVQKKNKRAVPVRMTLWLWLSCCRFRKMYMHRQNNVAYIPV